MDGADDDIVVAEGPLFLLWYTQDYGGHKIFAQWNGFCFDLYNNEAKAVWYGEAERLDQVGEWAWELLASFGVAPVEATGVPLPPGPRRGFPGSWG